jgi:methylmalonyl-CoA/ethylmalonyl-CoA epimerase
MHANSTGGGIMSEHEETREPTRTPAFTETVQIGILVRDLEASVRRFEEDFGIGPWQFWDVGPDNAPDLRHEGHPIRGATRCAAVTIGSVMWELFTPLDDEGIFARHLREKGEGVHHIAVVTDQQAKGRVLPLSGTFMNIECAYLPTEPDFGVLLEIYKGEFNGE